MPPAGDQTHEPVKDIPNRPIADHSPAVPQRIRPASGTSQPSELRPSLLLSPQFPPASCRQQCGYQINREAPNGITRCLSSLQPPGLTGRHFRMKMIIAVQCKQLELIFGITIDHWRLKLSVESPTTDEWEDCLHNRHQSGGP